MKICWDNLNELSLQPNGFFKKKNTCFYFKEFSSCENCNEPFLGRVYKKNIRFCSQECNLEYAHKTQKENLSGKIFGKLTVLEEDKSKDRLYWLCKCECGNIVSAQPGKLKNGTAWHCGCCHGLREDLTDKKFNNLTAIKFVKTISGHPYWLCRCDCSEELIISATNLKHHQVSCGCQRFLYGVSLVKEDLSSYDLLKDKLSRYEKLQYEVLPEFNNFKQLIVFCSYCGKAFRPTRRQVYNRLYAINGCIEGGEYKFYCSDYCKNACPIYRQIKWPRGFKPATSREVAVELRQMVLERDDWTCQFLDCGLTIEETELHCHHIIPVAMDGIISADIDNCITLCKEHHKLVHSKKGCTYKELKEC